MKKGNIEFFYFEKGDYVRTAMGVGIVTEDEPEIKTEQDLNWSDVKIQHKFGCSENTSNEIEEISREYLIRISKEE